MNCKLVYFSEDAVRKVIDSKYASNDDQVAFADGYPYYMFGQSSLDLLNENIADPNQKLKPNRFRPNLIFKGGKPFEEDTFGVI